MNYVIKLISGSLISITEKEFSNLTKMEKKGLVYIPSTKELVNLSCVERIYPNDGKHKLENRKNRNYGRLNDGTRVVKEFGIWEIATDNKIRIDPAYYPEVAKDTVMTEEEWEDNKENKGEEIIDLENYIDNYENYIDDYENLRTKEEKEKILKIMEGEANLSSTNSFSNIGDIIKNKKTLN